MMKQVNLNPDGVISRWEPYISLDSKLILKRARELLQPPKTVSLTVDENRILHATGYAPHQWIVETRERVRFISGITHFQENLTETELKELESSKEQIEKQVLYFVLGTTQLESGQDDTLQKLVSEVQQLLKSALFSGKDVQIKLLGHTDKQGSKEANIRLSQARAEAILSTLVSQGIKTSNLSAESANTKPLDTELIEQDKVFNRTVSFKVILTDAPNRGTVSQ